MILKASEEELKKISEKRQLSLSLDEMKAIQAYFSKLGREPTDVELETFAQTWSEHCIHKTFKGEIISKDKIENLFSKIANVTKELGYDWCFSVFEDNAGIVDFEGDVAIAFKVETHNHPSAIEPFGGAATGVGGVIRDILGVWGEPIANTNVLCFGYLDFPYEKLPKETKHPRFIYRYVISGIGNYGNNMGIPTVNGAIFFDESYTANPLVYCGTLGLVHKKKYKREAKPGDVLLLVGGKTGRDGIHGVTFASTELQENAEEIFGTAVQIGDPIEEEKIKRGILEIRDRELGSAITDLGGGGLSSAIGELAHKFGCGAKVKLDKVPLKYPKMAPWEIWVSESQERMLLCIPRKNLEKAIKVFENEEVEATPIGEFIKEKKLIVEFKGKVVAELEVPFLFRSLKVRRKAEWKRKINPEPDFVLGDLTLVLLKILASPNVASKESVIRTYDHEVKAMTVLKPMQGEKGDAPGDAAIIKPLPKSWKGIVISNGLNPEYGKIDPYWMAASAIDEAIRNNTAVGGRRIALLDNFCWGSPEKPQNVGGLLRATNACYDIAKSFGTPFISGKDSLYNESRTGAVTPTLLISAVGIIPDVRKAVSMDAKKPGNLVYILGLTKDELGGSHYYKVHGYLGNNVPKVDPLEAKKMMGKLIKAIDAGLVTSCHDLSEGGLGVGAAEMSFGGNVGMEIYLENVPVNKKMRDGHILFSESNSRFLVEVKEKNKEDFEKIMSGSVFALIGRTIKEKRLIISSRKILVSASLDSLKKAWQGTLTNVF